MIVFKNSKLRIFGYFLNEYNSKFSVLLNRWKSHSHLKQLDSIRKSYNLNPR